MLLGCADLFPNDAKALLTWMLAVLVSFMNSKQRKTLEAVFVIPTPKTLSFSEMESLFQAIGCEAIEGAGSRVAFTLRGIRVAFHRPHPKREAQAYQVRAAREFFEALGICPEI
jgi:hypothetical protein